jgi:hypothetical protein
MDHREEVRERERELIPLLHRVSLIEILIEILQPVAGLQDFILKREVI